MEMVCSFSQKQQGINFALIIIMMKQADWESSIFSNIMSLHHSQLRAFLGEIHNLQPSIPKIQIRSYLQKAKPSPSEISKSYQDLSFQFRKTYNRFKELIILIFMSLQQKQSILLLEGLSLLEDLMTHRMICLCFDGKGQFVLHENLMILGDLIFELVKNALNGSLEDRLVSMLLNANLNHSRFNQINFLVEALLISNIQRHLSEDSKSDFHIFLNSILIAKKKHFLAQNSQDLSSMDNFLIFQNIALLRYEDDSSDLYCLEIDEDKLINRVLKIPETIVEKEQWAFESFIMVPHHLNLSSFSSNSVIEVHRFLMCLEIFASSPLIEEVNQFISDENQLQLFSKYLMGESLSVKDYEFEWKKIRGILHTFHEESFRVPSCYRPILLQEVTNLLNGSK